MSFEFKPKDRVRVTARKQIELQLVGQEGEVDYVYPNGDVVVLLDWDARLTAFKQGELTRIANEDAK